MDIESRRKKLGETLAAIRKTKGISMNEVEKRVYTKFTQIKSIESGEDGYNIDTLFRYASAIGVDLNITPKNSLVLTFIEQNRNRNESIGDLCTDLLRDQHFLECENDTERIDHIKFVGKMRSDAVHETVRMFLKEFALYKSSAKKKKNQEKE